MTTDLLYIDLKDALLQNACPLCWQMEDHTRRTIVHFLREGKGVDQVFVSLVRSFGLCQRHAWLLAQIEPKAFGDGMATATLYDWLMDHSLRTLRWDRPADLRRRWWPFVRTENPVRHSAAALIEQLSPKGACHLCLQLGSYERVLAWGIQLFLSQSRGDDAFRALYQKSWGLCLPHFRMTLSEVDDALALKILVEVQRERMETISMELKEYLRKHDYRFAHEPYGPEGDAWVRVIALFTGGIPREILTRDAESRAGRKTNDE